MFTPNVNDFVHTVVNYLIGTDEHIFYAMKECNVPYQFDEEVAHQVEEHIVQCGICGYWKYLSYDAECKC